MKSFEEYRNFSEEQLDELNQMTLSRYAAKARADAKTQDDKEKAEKRKEGANTAYRKLKYGDYSEEVEISEEQLDELSKETLTSYIDKAATGPSRGTSPNGTLKSIKAIGGVAKAIGKRAQAQMKEDEDLDEDRVENTKKWVAPSPAAQNTNAAEAKKEKAKQIFLAKKAAVQAKLGMKEDAELEESVEQIDEISTDTLVSYRDKALKRKLPTQSYDRSKGMVHKDAEGKEISSQEAGRQIHKHIEGQRRAGEKILKNANKETGKKVHSFKDYGDHIQKQYYSGSGRNSGD